MRVLFCGINPSLASATTGHHYARPGNRFWPALHQAGFTPHLLRPDEDHKLPAYGLGLTNLVARPTRSAAELERREYIEGAMALARLVARHRPRVLAMVGLVAWRIGFGRPNATVGHQADVVVGSRPVWVVPNPSGLNAHYQMCDLVRLYSDLRVYATAQPG